MYSEATVGYSFLASDNTILRWPRELGAHLGQAGAYNFFLRAGFKVGLVRSSDLPGRLRERDFIVIDIPIGLPCEDRVIDKYVRSGFNLLFTGDFNRVAKLFGIEQLSFERPQRSYNSIGFEYGGRATPLQPPNWGSFVLKSGEDSRSFSGILFEIAGDRLSPQNSLKLQIPNSFFVAQTEISGAKVYYVNGLVFSALQSWLQGQEDLTPWLGWNSRQHWLDDYVDLLMEAMNRYIFDGVQFERFQLPNARSICLRHDNDDSVDFSFLELEAQSRVSATYALLIDDLLPQWQSMAKRYPNHEYALHFTTIAPKFRLNKYVKHFAFKTPLRRYLDQYVKGDAVIGRGGLVRQVRNAIAAGVSVRTLHRHFSYLPYPEFIDALQGVYSQNLGVLGSSSFFRGQLYRWGGSELDGVYSTVGQWPDSTCPFWMPFRVADAARRGQFLPGWENTLLMELESEFADQILKTGHRNLQNKFVMFCYHPARHKSSLGWLSDVISHAKASGFKFYRYDEFLSTMNSCLI